RRRVAACPPLLVPGPPPFEIGLGRTAAGALLAFQPEVVRPLEAADLLPVGDLGWRRFLVEPAGEGARRVGAHRDDVAAEPFLRQMDDRLPVGVLPVLEHPEATD